MWDSTRDISLRYNELCFSMRRMSIRCSGMSGSILTGSKMMMRILVGLGRTLISRWIEIISLGVHGVAFDAAQILRYYEWFEYHVFVYVKIST